MQNNRLFIIRWGWTSGGGHFLVGHGISGENIYYMNPWYGEGKKVATYEWVKSDPSHTWTHTNLCTVSAQLPAAPARIDGPASVCASGNRATYTVEPVARALTYQWSFPAGITGESTTNSIV